jgi:hypothetical protein
MILHHKIRCTSPVFSARLAQTNVGATATVVLVFPALLKLQFYTQLRNWGIQMKQSFLLTISYKGIEKRSSKVHMHKNIKEKRDTKQTEQ